MSFHPPHTTTTSLGKKMAKALAQTKHSSESSTNNDKSIKLLECREYADLEQHLHQALNELSSAQLSIDLCNKEHNQASVVTSVSQ